MYESVDDLTAPWLGAGIDLAKRMLALADELGGMAGEHIVDVVRCDYNPLPPAYRQLGDPPTLRPAAPPRAEPGS